MSQRYIQHNTKTLKPDMKNKLRQSPPLTLNLVTWQENICSEITGSQD